MCREKLDGPSYFTKRLLKQLQLLDKESEYVLLVSGMIQDAFSLFEITGNNFRVKKFSGIRGIYTRIFFEQFILPFFIRNGILYSPSVSLPLLPLFRVKKVTTIHDLIPFYYPTKYPFFQRCYFNSISRFASKLSDMIITVSQNSKMDIIKFFSISESKIIVIYNFLNSNIIEEYNPNNREDFFITVSTIQPGKNLKGVILAFHRFLQITDKQMKLYVIGNSGWADESVYELVDQLKINSYVLFTGYVSEDILNDYYRRSAGLIYLSFYEGFGIPPLEAMSFGCPVLVSNTSSLPEVTGNAGIYSDPYDDESIITGLIQLSNKDVVLEKASYFKSEVLKFNPERETMKLIECFKYLHEKN